MAQAYLAAGMTEDAVFSLFVRRLPTHRNYLLACGQAELLEEIADFRFSDSDIAWLSTLGEFSGEFLDWLVRFRFSGNIRAVPEGTPIFADEPVLEVEAPIAQAQILETLVMARVNLATLLASKAARVVAAAGGCTVVDFAARRMHGVDAAVTGARAFFIAGVNATSNVLAGRLYGIPVAGTMAHSFVQAHDDESKALRTFAEQFPDTTLLVDTYDTVAGVQRAIALASESKAPVRLSGVRLDSGDLLDLSRRVRSLLDDAGLTTVRIFASSGLDEYEIDRLLKAGAPIDGFGVGTRMGVSADSPELDLVYKLCLYAGKGRLKLSPSKPILPGRKQVFRHRDHDVIARSSETLPGRPLLRPVMRRGEILKDGRADLAAARRRAAEETAALPPSLRGLDEADPPWPVNISDALRHYTDEVKRKLRGHGVR